MKTCIDAERCAAAQNTENPKNSCRSSTQLRGAYLEYPSYTIKAKYVALTHLILSLIPRQRSGGKPCRKIRACACCRRTATSISRPPPFSPTEHDLAHLELEPALRSQIEITYYAGGHMYRGQRIARTRLNRPLKTILRGRRESLPAAVQGSPLLTQVA